jgi:hypothetical protein
VFLLTTGAADKVALVFDYDTALSFPCPAHLYAAQSFPTEGMYREDTQQWFRVVPSSTYLAGFASDRLDPMSPYAS